MTKTPPSPGDNDRRSDMTPTGESQVFGEHPAPQPSHLDQPHRPNFSDVADAFSAVLRAAALTRQSGEVDEFGVGTVADIDLDDLATDHLIAETARATGSVRSTAQRIGHVVAQLLHSSVATIFDCDGQPVAHRVRRDCYVGASMLLMSLLAKRCGLTLADDEAIQAQLYRTLSLRSPRTVDVIAAVDKALVPQSQQLTPGPVFNPQAPTVNVTGPRTLCKDKEALARRLEAVATVLREAKFNVDVVGNSVDRGRTNLKAPAYTREQRHRAAHSDGVVYLTDDEASLGAGKLFTWMEATGAPVLAIQRSRASLSQLQAGSHRYDEEQADNDEHELELLRAWLAVHGPLLREHARRRLATSRRLHAALAAAYELAAAAPAHRWDTAGLDRDHALELLADADVFAAQAGLHALNAIGEVIGENVVNDLIKRGRGAAGQEQSWSAPLGRGLTWKAIEGFGEAWERSNWPQDEALAVLTYAAAPPRMPGSDHMFRATTASDFDTVHALVYAGA